MAKANNEGFEYTDKLESAQAEFNMGSVVLNDTVKYSLSRAMNDYANAVSSHNCT